MQHIIVEGGGNGCRGKNENECAGGKKMKCGKGRGENCFEDEVKRKK